MSRSTWDGRGPVLVDTSAWIVARRVPEARERLLAAVERGDVAWCWPVRYELMVDARDLEAIGALDRTLEGLREIRVDRSVQQQVLATMRELARTSSHGAHRLSLTDLTVVAAGQSAGVDVVHLDHHIEQLGERLGVEAWWIADPDII